MFAFFAMVVVAALVLVALSAMRSALVSDRAYVRRSSLLSAQERSLLLALEQAVGANFRIQAKVAAAGVLDVDASLTGGNRAVALNRIGALHFDFVLLEPKTFVVVAAIQLMEKRLPQPDGLLNSVCVMAHLPLIQIEASASYDVQGLRQEVLHTLFPPVISSEVVESVVALMAAKS